MLVATIILTQLVCGHNPDASKRMVMAETKVITLAVKVTTRDLRGAGTDNAVYFDVGPWSWRLNKPWRNDFERGDTNTFKLDVPSGFTLDDVLWLRLHKKGLFGVTGTRDGFTGAWHPERITLLVNGTECNEEVPQSLNSRFWFWRNPNDFNPYLNPTNFVRSLRLKPNDAIRWPDKLIAFFTTPLFKRRGISGWLDCPEQKQAVGMDKPCEAAPKLVCATGKLSRSPAVSTDNLATIDLLLEKLEFCSANAACDQYVDLTTNPQFARPRYLRVEYHFKKKKFPTNGQTVRVCGSLQWDTDREGWWEIHTTKLE